MTIDFWATDLHGEEVGVRQDAQHRAKSRQFSKDMEIYGALFEDGKKVGFVGWRKEAWESGIDEEDEEIRTENYITNIEKDYDHSILGKKIMIKWELPEFIAEFIEKHHDKMETGGKRKDCEIPLIIRLLYAKWQGYDGMDSGLDKGRVMRRDKVGQRKDHTFIATAFGYEFKRIELSKIEDLTKNLQEIVTNALEQFKSDNDIIKLRKVIEKTKEYYLNFLGETRRPANDVTLWDHSYSVATLVKCAVSKNIIDCSNASFDPLDFNWKVFSVNFDTLGLLAKGVKLGDILGYWECIKRAFKRIKEIIEVEYPIGNEIYRDTTGIFFLVPDMELEELKSLILKELKSMSI